MVSVTKMRNALLSLCSLLLTISVLAQSPPQSKRDKTAIQRAKSTLVSSLDNRLPKVTLEFFLKEEGKGAPIAWEVNDCGEQTGNPADEISDVPTCVEADMSLKDGRSVTLFVAVGTAKHGISGSPTLFGSVDVTDQNGMVHPLRHLSDLPVELNRPRPKSPKDVPSPSGATASSQRLS